MYEANFSTYHNRMLPLQGVRLASKFEDLLRKDQRFEIPASRVLGMVVFRLWVRKQSL